MIWGPETFISMEDRVSQSLFDFVGNRRSWSVVLGVPNLGKGTEDFTRPPRKNHDLW